MEVYFFNIILGIVELTNIMLCYSQLLRVKLTNKVNRIVLWYMGIILVDVFRLYYGGNISIEFIDLVYGLLTIWFVTECRAIHAIGLYICAYMIETIINTEISYIYAIVANIPQFTVTDKISITIIIDSSFWVIMLIKMVMEKYFVRQKKYKYTFDGVMYIALYIGSISFMLILSAINFMGDRFGIPYNQTNLLGLLLTTVCIVFFILFFWLANSVYKNELYQREKDMMQMYVVEQEKYINLVVEKDADMRGFRHDLKEQMNVILGMLSRKEYDKVYTYIDKLYENYSCTVIETYTRNKAVDAIISQKRKIMDENRIKFIWNGSDLDIPETIEVYDICTIFANILNNAIEACSGLDISERYIEIKTRISGDCIYILERNNMMGVVEFDEQDNPISSKKDRKNHGYGTKNIRHVVEKYNGTIMYSVKNDKFTLELKI